MTGHEIKQGNELIAELIGMQKTDIGWFDYNELLNTGNNNTFDELLFHEDYNWLIPAASAIVVMGQKINHDDQDIHFIEDAITNNNLAELFNLCVHYVKKNSIKIEIVNTLLKNPPYAELEFSWRDVRFPAHQTVVEMKHYDYHIDGNRAEVWVYPTENLSAEVSVEVDKDSLDQMRDAISRAVDKIGEQDIAHGLFKSLELLNKIADLLIETKRRKV